MRVGRFCLYAARLTLSSSKAWVLSLGEGTELSEGVLGLPDAPCFGRRATRRSGRRGRRREEPPRCARWLPSPSLTPSAAPGSTRASACSYARASLTGRASAGPGPGRPRRFRTHPDRSVLSRATFVGASRLFAASTALARVPRARCPHLPTFAAQLRLGLPAAFDLGPNP